MQTFRLAAIGVTLATLPAAPLDAQGLSSRAAPPELPAAEAEAFRFSVPRAPGAVEVDGRLDEQEWVGAAHVDGFTEVLPKEGAEPRVRTEAMMMYDRTHLYVAFRAHDDPTRVRATLQERDKVFQDDWVMITLDTYGASSWAYGIGANPLGVQLDMRDEGMRGHPSLDLLFRSAGRITDDGYVVELAIPFSSLRFPSADVHDWRINFLRNHPREDRHIYTWAPLTLDNPCLLCQAGSATGMEGVRAGGRLDLLPSLVASQSGGVADAGDPAATFHNASPTADVGVGLKYDLGGWTAEATYNPDFSQVEADAAQIDVNSALAIQYPERRPFFQEGAELFSTPLPVVYSRSINDPSWAGKLTGRLGGTDVSVLSARDEHTPLVLPFDGRSVIRQTGASTASVLRAKHNLSSGSYVGAMVSDRRFDGGGSGTSYGVDGSHRFRTVYELAYQVVGSHTVEAEDSGIDMPAGLRFGEDGRYTAALDGESYSGKAGYLSLSRSDKRTGLEATYREASPTYRADNGFQRNNDYRDVELSGRLVFQPRTALVSRVVPGLRVTRGWTYQGEHRLERVIPSVSFELTRQTRGEVAAHYRNESFGGTRFQGLRGASLFLMSNFSDPVSLGFRVWHGDEIARFLQTPALGRETAVGAWATLKPVQRVTIEPNLSYARMTDGEGEELYAGYVARTKFNYQFTRELFFRLTAQYNDFSGRVDVDPLLTYKVNPYTLFYVGSTHGLDWSDEARGPLQTERQLFLKMQYLLRR